jgi:transposase
MVKKYTLEFKQEAARLVTEKGYSQTDAGKALGVDPKNIHNWVKCYATNKKTEKALSPDQEEMKRLRKENERLKMEREILKKAAAFFANEKP